MAQTSRPSDTFVCVARTVCAAPGAGPRVVGCMAGDTYKMRHTRRCIRPFTMLATSGNDRLNEWPPYCKAGIMENAPLHSLYTAIQSMQRTAWRMQTMQCLSRTSQSDAAHSSGPVRLNETQHQGSATPQRYGAGHRNEAPLGGRRKCPCGPAKFLSHSRHSLPNWHERVP